MHPNERRIGAVALFVVLLVLAFFLIRPFIIPLVSAVILAYVFYPLYKLFNKWVKRKGLASIITTILIIAIIAVPSFLIANKVTSEVYLVYLTSKQKLRTGSLFTGECDSQNTFLCKIDNAFKDFTLTPRYQFYTEEALDKMKSFFLKQASEAVLSVPRIALSLFVMFFATFYLFIGGSGIAKKIKKLIPFKENHQELFIRKFSDITHATIYGTLIIALTQGALGALGFVIFGVKSPLIWGLVMAFFALIPFVGPAVIYVPASLFMVLDGMSQSSTSIVVKGILLLLWGVLIVSSIDNILRPKIVGDRANLHPILVLIGVLGGLAMMGFIGIVVGPLILAFLITFLDIQIKKSS